MHLRSWMATLLVGGGFTVLAELPSIGQQPESNRVEARTESLEQPKPHEGRATDAHAVSPSLLAVELNLMIAGLGHEGCDVEIKPGNPGSRFQVQKKHIGASGKGNFVFRDVEVRGADHNCSFAITVRQPGQAPKTIFRGFRMNTRVTSGSPTPTLQSFTCYMNSPSKLAALERPDKVRR